MMLAGLPVQTSPAKAPAWRAAAARDADRAATKPDQYVTAMRRDVVRQALEVLVDPTELWDRELRRAHSLNLLADSVEKQARFSGLGRDIRIPRAVA